MKHKVVVILLSLYSYCNAFSLDSLLLQNYPSLFGSTGAVLTPDARTPGRFRGSIGVYENFQTELEDNLLFLSGIHDQLEVGLQSDIPAQADPELNFFFKIRGNSQGSYFGSTIN
jgi:hypothetical protein